MFARITVPWIFAIWMVVGLVVAITRGFGRDLAGGSDVATFLLAAFLWPIPALGGDVSINLP